MKPYVAQRISPHAPWLVLGALLMLVVACDEPAPTQQTLSIDVFRLTAAEYPEWSELRYVEYDTTSFFNLINGGASFYNERGLVKGAYQDLRGGDTTETADLPVAKIKDSRQPFDVGV